MVSRFTLKEFTLAAFTPRASSSIIGIVGPATKGPVNEIGVYTSEGNFVSGRGTPVDNQHGPRAAIKALRKSNQLKHVRIAGTFLKNAFVEQFKPVNSVIIPIITFTAVDPGSWANGVVEISIIHNGNPVTSYDIQVRVRDGEIVENFQNLTNSNVVNTINNNSNVVRVALSDDAGIEIPDTTFNALIGQNFPLVLNGGRDGAFATTESPDSLTAGFGAQNSYTYDITFDGSITFLGNEGKPIVPGSFSADDGTESFSDNQDGSLTGSVSGTGRIDYRTGVWSITFAAAPTADITIALEQGTLEQIDSLSTGVLNYGGFLGRRGVRPSSLAMIDSRAYQLDIGDGATAAYTETLGGPILKGSVRITTVDSNNNGMVVTDDGDGGLIGDVTVVGTINYLTGAVSWTFNANVQLNAPINSSFECVIEDDGSGVLTGNTVAGTINYQTGEYTLVYTLTPVGDFIPGVENGNPIEAIFKHVTVAAFGDASEMAFTGRLEEFPVKPGSVELTFGIGGVLTDDGNGNLTGAGGTGTIDYFTGQYTLDLTGAPALNFAVRFDYSTIIIDAVAKYHGPIGQRRTVLTDGLYVHIDQSPSTPTNSPNTVWYRVRVFFNDGTGAAAIETFDVLKTTQEMLDTVNDAVNGSEFITLQEKQGGVGNVDITLNSNQGQEVGMAGAFTNADVIGVSTGTTKTGMQLFADEDIEPLDILSCPGIWHRQVILEGLRLASTRNLLFVCSLPDFDNPFDHNDYMNGEYNALSPGATARPTAVAPFPPLTVVDSVFGFYFGSWVQYFDQYKGEDVFEGPEGSILEIMAEVEQRFGTHQTISGLRRGQLADVSDVRYAMTLGERQQTFGLVGTREEVLNPVLKFVGQGIFLFEQATLGRESGSPMNRIGPRWTQNKINRNLKVIGRSFSHEANDEQLWREVRSKINRILKPLAAEKALVDYRVVCDSSTNTRESLLQRKLVAKIFITHVETAEEIEFQAIFVREGTDFNLVAPLV